jgi:hypothetical protein
LQLLFPRTSKLRKRRIFNNTFQNQNMFTVSFSSEIRFQFVQLFKQFFTDSIWNTMCHVRETLGENDYRGIETILLVGDSLNQKLFKMRYEQRFQTNCLNSKWIWSVLLFWKELYSLSTTQK